VIAYARCDLTKVCLHLCSPCGIAVLYPLAGVAAPSLLEPSSVSVVLLGSPSCGPRRRRRELFEAHGVSTAFGSVWIMLSWRTSRCCYPTPCLVCFARGGPRLRRLCCGRGCATSVGRACRCPRLGPNRQVGWTGWRHRRRVRRPDVLGTISIGSAHRRWRSADYIGDLLESMLKRRSGRMTQAYWRPGFGACSTDRLAASGPTRLRRLGLRYQTGLITFLAVDRPSGRRSVRLVSCSCGVSPCFSWFLFAEWRCPVRRRSARA